MDYEMQVCGCPGGIWDDACWLSISEGYFGPNDGWTTGSNPDPEPVQIPEEGSPDYSIFFGDGVLNSCDSSWLRLRRHPSYTQDTSVWELPFLRPRLIR
jgi:hypothetical protein